MTGLEVRDMLHEKIKDYLRTNHKPPKLIRLPVLLAHDLSKCGLNELGPLAEKIATEGIGALVKYGYQGHPVKLELEEENEIIIE